MEKPKRARRRKPDTAKVDLKPPIAVLWRTGCPPRGGIRRVCGEVPGRSRGSDPGANRSAKGGARSSPHYGGEGVLIHPPNQGVCGRHGTEDSWVTPGDLVMSLSGIGGRDPISESEVGNGAWREVGRSNSTSTMVKAMGPETGAGMGPGRRPARTAGKEWLRENEQGRGGGTVP